MNIGYARVSTNEQDTAAQLAELKKAGCTKIYHETMSGGAHKPELRKALEHLREGDVLVVWKLDRLSRSLKDLLFTMERITEAKAGFRSLTEHVDTTTPAGRLMMNMLGSFAQFEKDMIRERTRLGLKEARAQGRIGGRPKKLNPHRCKAAVAMVVNGEKTQAEVARMFDVSRSVISRMISKERVLEAVA